MYNKVGSPDGLTQGMAFYGNRSMWVPDSSEYSDFGVCGFLRYDDMPGGSTPFQIRGTLAVRDFFVELTRNVGIPTNTTTLTLPDGQFVVADTDIADGDWHHLAFWRAGDHVSVAVDGTVISSFTYSTDIVGGESIVAGFEGRDRYSVCEVFDFRVYFKQLSASVVSSLYSDVTTNAGAKTLPLE